MGNQNSIDNNIDDDNDNNNDILSPTNSNNSNRTYLIQPGNSNNNSNSNNTIRSGAYTLLTNVDDHVDDYTSYNLHDQTMNLLESQSNTSSHVNDIIHNNNNNQSQQVVYTIPQTAQQNSNNNININNNTQQQQQNNNNNYNNNNHHYTQLTPTQLRQLIAQGLDPDICFVPYQMNRLKYSSNIVSQQLNNINKRNTITVYNNCNIHKNSITLYNTNNNKLMLSFILDCNVDTIINIHYLAHEILDNNNNTTSIISQYKTQNYIIQQNNYNYQFISNDVDSIDINMINNNNMYYNISNRYYPIIIEYKPVNAVANTIDISYVYCTLLYNNTNQLICKVIKQKVNYDNITYDINEIYGINDNIQNNECVICYSEIKTTVVLPCKHYCLCNNCSQLLQKQTTPKCPLCRTRVESIAQIKQQLDTG